MVLFPCVPLRQGLLVLLSSLLVIKVPPNTAPFYVVDAVMDKSERHNLISTLGDKALRDKFDINPYGLSQDELLALQSYDRLAAKIERLLKDVLVQNALNNSLRHKQ